MNEAEILKHIYQARINLRRMDTCKLESFSRALGSERLDVRHLTGSFAQIHEIRAQRRWCDRSGRASEMKPALFSASMSRLMPAASVGCMISGVVIIIRINTIRDDSGHTVVVECRRAKPASALEMNKRIVESLNSASQHIHSQ